MESILPMRMMIMMIRVGAMPGKVTYRSSCNLLAPSTFMASYSVGDMPMIAAKYTMELYPLSFQMPTAMYRGRK